MEKEGNKIVFYFWKLYHKIFICILSYTKQLSWVSFPSWKKKNPRAIWGKTESSNVSQARVYEMNMKSLSSDEFHDFIIFSKT